MYNIKNMNTVYITVLLKHRQRQN